MVFLKDDGSLDIERIDQLPIEEHMKMIGELTDEQYHLYTSTLPVNEGYQHTKAVVVDYTMEDEIKRGTGVDLEELLTKLRKELGLKSQ